MYPDRDTFEQLYPARDTLQHVIKGCWKVARQKAGKHSASVFFFFVNEHNNTKMKPLTKTNDFKSYPRRETAAVGGKRCR